MTRRLVVSLLLLSLSTFTCLAASQGASPQSVTVGQSVMAGQIVAKVAPIYPPLARQARVQGAVVLEATISENGEIVDLHVVSGHPMLVTAAVEAVKQWRYRPYLLNGQPVSVQTQIQVNFRLDSAN